MDTNNIFGGNGMWLIVLLLFIFLFMFNNNGGFGGLGNNAAAWLLGNQNNNNNHDNTVDLISNNTMWQNQMFAQQNLANQTNLISTGFCGVNQNIERAIQQGQANTATMIAAVNADTQRILDMLCSQETQRLRTELAEARVIAQNNQQTNELIARLAPVATPSRLVNSPYTSIYPPTTPTTTNG